MPKTTSTGRELLAEWVAALASGEWAQTWGELRVPCGDGFCFCAIGCLYDLICTSWEIAEDEAYAMLGADEIEPLDLFQYFKMPIGFNENADRRAIMDVNDEDRLTFPEIAGVITATHALTPAEIAAGRARLIASGAMKGAA